MHASSHYNAARTHVAVTAACFYTVLDQFTSK